MKSLNFNIFFDIFPVLDRIPTLKIFNYKRNLSEVLLIEIAQQCNVSVRDIHFAAKELGQDLSPTAKSVDSKIAKTLVDHFQNKEVEAPIKKVKVTKPSAKKIDVSKPKPKISDNVSKDQEKKKEKSRKPAFVVIEKKERPIDKVQNKDSKAQPKEEKKTKKVFENRQTPSTSSNNKKNRVEKLSKKQQRIKEKQEKRALEAMEGEKKEKKKRKKVIEKRDTTISDELLGIDKNGQPRNTAEIYDEYFSEEREREIVHTQRKKTAGKDNVKKAPTISHTVKYDPNRIVEIPDVISVKEFAEKTGLGAAKIIGELMKNGILANINQQIDFETALIISGDLNVKIKKKQSAGSAEDLMKGNLQSLMAESDDSVLVERPPIVVVMGHVDHGKTKLLDSIRKTDVVAGESGGITQHIAAYQVEQNGKKITFIDTPGHEAFTQMRARGAKVTDIAILVVAADEGVKPQTIEALQHAKDAGVPLIVAITKIDKPNADVDRVKGELVQYDLTPEDWGGKTIMVPVSAMTKEGLPELLDMILLLAEMEKLTANYDRDAIGTVIESHLDPSLGHVATIIINTGTLHLTDNVVIGEGYGRIKVLRDHYGKKITAAGPSTPVLIAGLSEETQSGDILQAVNDEKTARQKAISIKHLKDAQQRERGVGEIMSALSSGQIKQLKLVLKADTQGSLEAIKQSINEIKNDDVGVKIILSGVGDISESDVMMAAASGGIVIGFHVKETLNALNVAEKENVEVLHYDIIYKLLDDIKKILTGMLEPEFKEVVQGHLDVKAIFYSKKKETIVGCQVTDGFVKKDSKIRLIRNGEIIGEIKIDSLQKNQDTVHEVKEGSECGLKVKGAIKPEEGDILESYTIEKTIRTL
ncbi:translation initiation factor IF-2 [Candidatus Peregrinibacteria bacterium]|nr:translation initiation factor IF-2 [Candidatus Peregrinibacteria bacterium]